MTTSFKPNRSRAYSEDLQWRVIWQSEALNYKPSTIAKNLSIDEPTVRRVLHIFTTTGDVSKKQYPAERAFKLIKEPVKLFIIHLLLRKPVAKNHI